VGKRPYWFFKYWPDPLIDLDVIDFSKIPLLHSFESRVLHFYVRQSLIAFVKRKKYDLIISHSARSALVFALLRSVIKELSPLHVVIDPGSFNGGRNNLAETYLIKKASRSLGGIIPHSSIQSEYYKEHMPLTPYRFIPFGVDTDEFRPMNLQQQDYILSFGSRSRDYPTLIEAWERVKHNNIRLKIIGVHNIPGVDRLPDDVDLVSRVSILSLKDSIAKARFVVVPLPYYKYSYGQMTFLQSMALGKSCIVTKTPSSQDYLTDNEDALFVRPYDSEDLSRKIEVLLEDDNMNNKIAINARRTIENKYNEKNMAKEIYDFIMGLI
jgi:glycosyltransferase involved in cell wall biosynthesis